MIKVCVETLSLGELLYSVEFGTKILIRKLEKLIRKWANIKLTVSLNQVCMYIYIYTHIYHVD